MILKVVDRLMLMGVLPQQSDMLTARIVSDLRQKVGFSEKEHEHLGMKRTEDGNLQWTAEKDTGKDFTFGPRAKVIVKEALEALDKKKQLTSAHISLWEKFIGPIKLDDDEKITVEEPATE